MGKCVIRDCKKSGYILAFDKDEGQFIRQGKNGSDPFWNVEGPELLDISITNYCERKCEFCYRLSNQKGKHMTLEDYKMIVEQAQKMGVLQIALGGGNPNQHPNFIEILQITREYGIVPSYTTNGQGITKNILRATKDNCGAVAISWYNPHKEAMAVIRECNEYGIKVNIHFMLDKNTVIEAIKLLKEGDEILKLVNAIVFLNYKPIHTSTEVTLQKSKHIQEFLECVKNAKVCKIGFDSCMISYLTLMSDSFWMDTVDYCEAARFSAFISEELIMYPCSFYNDVGAVGVNLRKDSMKYGWQQGGEFLEIRKRLITPGGQEYPVDLCNDCEKFHMCHGGCPKFNINMCGR